ncbi:MAG: hypothetical protein QOK64_06700 [Nitrososphaeraceae archaeon]|nr:hypothetical protein [Nitrososphaeraceae archaeon]
MGSKQKMNNLNIFLVVLITAGLLGVIFCSTSFATVGNELSGGNEFINKGLDNSTNSTAKEYQREPGKLEVPNLKLDFNTSRDFERKAGQDPLEFNMTNQMADMKLDKDFLPPGGGSGELQNFKNNTLAPDTLIK